MDEETSGRNYIFPPIELLRSGEDGTAYADDQHTSDSSLDETVFLRTLLEDSSFKTNKSATTFPIGRDDSGIPVYGDLKDLLHVLVTGAPGTGKSTFIHAIVTSFLYHASPDDVKLVLLDPGGVELTAYDGVPHLLFPVITDVDKAVKVLEWCVAEMNARYHRFANVRVRDIDGFNRVVRESKGTKPRTILMTERQFEQYCNENLQR